MSLLQPLTVAVADGTVDVVDAVVVITVVGIDGVTVVVESLTVVVADRIVDVVDVMVVITVLGVDGATVVVEVTMTRVDGTTVVVSTTIDVETGTEEILELLLNEALTVEATKTVDVAKVVLFRNWPRVGYEQRPQANGWSPDSELQVP